MCNCAVGRVDRGVCVTTVGRVNMRVCVSVLLAGSVGEYV